VAPAGGAGERGAACKRLAVLRRRPPAVLPPERLHLVVGQRPVPHQTNCMRTMDVCVIVSEETAQRQQKRKILQKSYLPCQSVLMSSSQTSENPSLLVIDGSIDPMLCLQTNSLLSSLPWKNKCARNDQ
jgi:hypothetical protein